MSAVDEVDQARLAVAFGSVARATGLEASVSAVQSFAEALSAVGLSSPDHVYWAGHAVFVRRPEDIPVYSEAFAAFWSGRAVATTALTAIAATVAHDDDDDASEPPDSEPGGEVPDRTLVLRYSATEVLRDKDFASLSPEELAEAYLLMASFRSRAAWRRSRRRRPTSRRSGQLDIRRSVRRALRTSGEPLRLMRLAPSERRRPIVLLVDVSGSMEPYARAFLHFAHAAVAARTHVEAFTLGTRLTRITRELAWRDPDAALGKAAASVPDLAGGTRLGEGLRAFNDRWGVAGVARGAVVVILSDGWDRGDPLELAAEMARLRRVAYRIIWANPLKSTPGYAPLARGMAAALPFVDDFTEGHSLRALEHLVEVMAR
jgi:uncharacterized protein with von Willebrand factor type A (vWA) domain